MPTFPTPKVHRYSRRQLGRGEQAYLAGGMFYGQNIQWTDLGFSSSAGVAVNSIFTNPTTIGGLLVVSAIFDNTHTPALTITDSSGSNVTAADVGPVTLSGSIVLATYSRLVRPGPLTVTLAAAVMNTAVMAFRQGIINGLVNNALDTSNNGSGAGLPSSGQATAGGQNRMAVGSVALLNPPAGEQWQGGFQQSGGIVSYTVAGTPYSLTQARLRSLQPTALTAQLNQQAVGFAAILGLYK